MKSKSRGWAWTALSILLAMATVLAACSKSGSNGAEPSGSASAAPGASQSQSDDPDDKKLPGEVSISMFDRGQVSSDEGTYEDNRWVKWIREQSGINVSIVPVPRNQAQEKLNVLIASNQAPDLIWEYDRNYIGQLVTQGVIQPIDEYIEKYSTSYKAYLEQHPELKPYLTFDGKTYAVTTKRAVNTVANHGMWIRQDWLDKLKLKAPTTVEELVEVAKAFKDGDPDGNGKPDTVPIIGYTSFDIYSSFFAAVNNQWYLEDGKMKYGATLDRFGDAIGLEKQLFELGLVDKEYLTDKGNQRAIQMWSTGKSGICMCQWGSGNTEVMMKDLMKNVPEAKPVPLESVASKYGKFGLYQETPAFIYVTFNKNMKNPKAAIEYLDWIFDHWTSLAYGMEGVHHRLVNGVPQYIDFEKYKKEALYSNEYAVLRPEEMKTEDLLVRAASDPLSQTYGKLQVLGLETAMKNQFRRDVPYQPSFPEISEIQATLKVFLEEIRAKAVMQGKDYTGEWALGEIREEWNRVGGEKAEQIAQEWYERNKGSFE